VSLINKMLRDLDERQASASERAGLAGQVRPLPPVRRFPWSRVLLVFAGVLAGAAGLWLILEGQRQLISATNAVSAQPVVAPAAQVPPAPTPEPAVIAMPALVVPMPNEDRETSVAVADPSPPASSVETLRLDVMLRQPPVERAVGGQRGADDHARTSIGSASAAIDKRSSEPSGLGAAEAEYRKAMMAYRQGRSSEAWTGMESALRLDGRHTAARQALLSLLIEQKRWPEAQSLAADGLALDAAQPGWAMILARLQVEQAQPADALETLARYAAHGARNPDYQAFYALLLQKAGRPKEAVERFRAATALRPGEGRWWYGLGVALDADQRPQEAREAFRQARDAGNLPPELAARLDQRLR
jgi:MSHA biogenesis protein MshN